MNAKHLIIQLDSLHKVDQEKWRGCIIVLDEIKSILKHLTMSPTLARNRTTIYVTFLNMLKHASFLLAMDADLDNETIKFMKSLRDEHTTLTLENKYKPKEGKKCTSFESIETLYETLKKQIFEDELQPIVCFDSKSYLKVVFERLRQEAERKGVEDEFLKHSVVYTAEEGSREDIGRINERWRDKIVFYSPRIVYGVDFNNDRHRNVFLFGENTDRRQTLNAIELGQMISRTRNIEHLYYYISEKQKAIRYQSIEDVRNYYSEALRITEDKIQSILHDKDNKLSYSYDEERNIVP